MLTTVKNDATYTGYLHRRFHIVPMMTIRTDHRRQQKCVKCHDDSRIESMIKSQIPTLLHMIVWGCVVHMCSYRTTSALESQYRELWFPGCKNYSHLLFTDSSTSINTRQQKTNHHRIINRHEQSSTDNISIIISSLVEPFGDNVNKIPKKPWPKLVNWRWMLQSSIS
jgi:hypothetical protein